MKKISTEMLKNICCIHLILNDPVFMLSVGYCINFKIKQFLHNIIRKQRHNCWTLHNKVSNGVLIVKIGYVLADLQAIKD